MGINANCNYCGMDMGFMATTCSYCGQVQPQHKKKKTPTQTPKAIPISTTLSSPAGKNISTQNSVPANQVDSVLSALRQIQTTVNNQQGQKSYKKQAVSSVQKTPTVKKKPGMISRFFFYSGLFCWWALFKPILDTFLDPRGVFDTKLGEGHAIMASIILFFTLIFFCRGTWRVWMAQIAAGMSAFFLLVKPWLFPIQYQWQTSDGQMGSFTYSYTSETHLFLVLPGMIWAVIAFILSASLAGRMTK